MKEVNIVLNLSERKRF